MKKMILICPSILIVVPMILNILLDSAEYSSMKGFIVLSLVLLNGLVMFAQGILSGRFNIDIKFSVGVTTAIYLFAVLVFLNSSALGYVVIGFWLGLLGNKLGVKSLEFKI
ncbi:MAG: hypothetical protein ACRC28_10965 [Clostridium sp.]|uniref:hypothetical protein n=1 Tax=Clostridium sp. TaxID=1506 RepID=UPI003F40A010